MYLKTGRVGFQTPKTNGRWECDTLPITTAKWEGFLALKIGGR